MFQSSILKDLTYPPRLPSARKYCDNISRLLFDNLHSYIRFVFFSTEEVLNSDHALYFSPDSQFLAYIQFNDSKVNWYQFPWYGDRKNAYTTIRKIAYPKPGYSNPTVKVFVIDLKNNKRVQLPEPSSFKDMWVFS